MNLRKDLFLRDDENILQVYRHHFLRYLGGLLVAAVLMTLPFALMLPLLSWKKGGLLALAGLFAVGAISALRLVTVWRGSMLVVTSARAIDVDRRGFFHRVVSEAPYEIIGDVSYRIDGVLGTLFRFGTLSLEISAGNRIVFGHLYQPQAAHRQLSDQVALRRAKPVTATERVSALIDAAAELSPAEARALRTALDRTPSAPPAAPPKKRPLSDKDVAPFVR